MDIEEIRAALLAGAYDVRIHAADQAEVRGITRPEILSAVVAGEIIEEYPTYYLGPCCLIYGQTATGRHLHVVVSAPPACWIITVYEPNPDLWVDYRIRR